MRHGVREGCLDGLGKRRSVCAAPPPSGAPALLLVQQLASETCLKGQGNGLDGTVVKKPRAAAKSTIQCGHSPESIRRPDTRTEGAAEAHYTSYSTRHGARQDPPYSTAPVLVSVMEDLTSRKISAASLCEAE